MYVRHAQLIEELSHSGEDLSKSRVDARTFVFRALL
jgi:hypothetical protein